MTANLDSSEYVVPLSSRYWAIHFSSRSIQPATFALFGYAHLMDGLAQASQEVIANKSTWWHEELNYLEQRNARHPITLTLQKEINRHGNGLGKVRAKKIIASLHHHLHGALMTQQKMPLATDEDWNRYAEMRIGSLFVGLELINGQPVEHADALGAWAGRINLLSTHKAPEAYADRRWLCPNNLARPGQPDQSVEELFVTWLKQRPSQGSAATAVLLHHDISWWSNKRQDQVQPVPSYSHLPVGLKGLLASWRVARQTQDKHS